MMLYTLPLVVIPRFPLHLRNPLHLYAIQALTGLYKVLHASLSYGIIRMAVKINSEKTLFFYSVFFFSSLLA